MNLFKLVIRFLITEYQSYTDVYNKIIKLRKTTCQQFVFWKAPISIGQKIQLRPDHCYDNEISR